MSKSLDDEFSPDEMAYLKSGGADTEALNRAYSGRVEEPEDDEDERPASKRRSEEKPAQKAPAASQDGDDDDDDDDDDEEGEGRPSKHVPHGRFHKERERRRAAQKEAEELRLRNAKAEERLAILNEHFMRGGDDDDEQPAAQNGQKPGKQVEKKASALEEADIDPFTDFAGAMDQLRRRQAEQMQAFRDFQEQVKTGQQQQEAKTVDEQRARQYAQDAIAYQQRDPSFRDAYQHLMHTYHRELEAFGMTDVKQRNAHIRQEEKKLANWAIENGRNPAEVLYQVSVSRGFAKKEQRQEENDDKPAGEEVKQKIKNIDRGQKSTASLSGGGGGAKKDLTMDAMLAMSDDEFYEKVHKMNPSKRRKLLGGG